MYDEAFAIGTGPAAAAGASVLARALCIRATVAVAELGGPPLTLSAGTAGAGFGTSLLVALRAADSLSKLLRPAFLLLDFEPFGVSTMLCGDFGLFSSMPSAAAIATAAARLDILLSSCLYFL